jgi:hypothetical protein
VDEQGCVRHLRFPEPLLVVMNGKAREAMIFQSRVCLPQKERALNTENNSRRLR